jgi:leader peptidase (prepilin peptidase)/N-methyltransferase
LHVLMGGLLSCGVGTAAWLAAGWLAARYRAAADPEAVAGAPRRAWAALSPVASLVMVGMAAWGAYVGWRMPDVPHTLPALLVTGLLLSIVLVDFQVRRIPNALVLALLVWAVAQMLWLGRPSPVAAGLGVLAAGGLLGLIALVTRGAMGAGDVKFAAALGAGLGYPLILPALFYGIVAAGVAALLLLVTRRARRRDFMAYGPYLALGAWIVWTRALGLWP